MDMSLDQKIEGILFVKAEGVSIKKLIEFLNTSEDDVRNALIDLENKLKDRGLQLIYKENEVRLGTKRELGSFLENLQKDELNKELSKASLETLSIILYKNGVSRSEIDYIRGVNSNFIIRNLLIRGLIEKTTDPKDSRKQIFKPTIETLAFMGISRVEDLTDYENIKNILDQKEIELKEEIQNNLN